jgi:putative Ca2+/H+ antiporter (TMEM165/GDT1 family)
MRAFLVSFALIFAAEMGDKSQLMALAFATRYRPGPVLIGITLATGVVHAVSVAVGAVLGAQLPTRALSFTAAVAFFGFAAWTLRGDLLSAEEAARAERTGRSAVAAVGAAFLLAELGDKTMLATITLSTSGGLFGTWLGSTAGMVVADAIAIGIGGWLGARLPAVITRSAAAFSFVVFGMLLLFDALRA